MILTSYKKDRGEHPLDRAFLTSKAKQSTLSNRVKGRGDQSLLSTPTLTAPSLKLWSVSDLPRRRGRGQKLLKGGSGKFVFSYGMIIYKADQDKKYPYPRRPPLKGREGWEEFNDGKNLS